MTASNVSNQDRVLPVEGIDFDYIELDEKELESNNPVVVLYGDEYEGVIVQYGKIGLTIDDDPPRVAFDFYISRANKKHSEDELKNDARFKTLLGDIIMSTIIDMARRKEAEDNEGRNNNSEGTSQE